MILAITVYALKGDREICIAAVMKDYLAKPLQKDGLREALSRRYPKESLSKSSEAAEAISV